MKARLLGLHGLLIFFMSVANVSSAFAKPADLPAHEPIECGDDPPAHGRIEIELGLSPKGITLKFGATFEEPSETPAIDAVLPAFVDQWLQHMGDVLTQPRRAVNLQALWGMLPNLRTNEEKRAEKTAEQILNARRAQIAAMDRTKQPKRLFDLAEELRQKGDYAHARPIYQQVHRMAPTSELGKRAIERLTRIEEQLRDAEEQSQPEPECEPQSLFHSLRGHSVPLGLVELWY